MESPLIQNRLTNPALPYVVPFLLFIALMASAETIVNLAGYSNSLDERWLYGVRTALVSLAVVWYWPKYSELCRAANLRPARILSAVAMGIVIFVAWINLDFGWLKFGESTGFVPLNADGKILWAHVIPRVLGAAILVPVIEELFWRSFLMRWLERSDFLTVVPSQIKMKSLVISSVLFALEHHLWFAGLVAGLAYGWLYMRTANLWYPIIAHATTNAVLGIWVIYTGNWQFW